jgi:DNA-binding transcriptional LysR family regulator
MDLAAALRAFVRTVERGSVTAAARDLAVSQPAVTKHLRNLERHVGARLLERSSRTLRTTPQGQTLYEAGRSALMLIDSALDGVRRDMGAIEGTLRVHAPACVGAKHFQDIVRGFQSQYPEVVVDLVLENRTVDLAYENFDLALKYGRPDSQELVIRRIGLVRRILAASPAFIAEHGPIDSLERLAKARLIVTHNGATPADTLMLQRRGQTTNLAVRPVLRTNNAEVIVSTLLSGFAAGPVQELLVSRELADGDLVRVLPEYELKPTDAFLVYPSVRFMRPVVRAFSDFAIAALRRVNGISTDESIGTERATAREASRA